MLLLMPVPDARTYAWKLTPADRKEVTQLVSNQLADEFLADVVGIEEDMALKDVSGREQLAFYESQDATYWMEMIAHYPDVARQAFLEFSRLDRRYNPQLEDIV